MSLYTAIGGMSCDCSLVLQDDITMTLASTNSKSRHRRDMDSEVKSDVKPLQT